jgi:hypothetical protein
MNPILICLVTLCVLAVLILVGVLLCWRVLLDIHQDPDRRGFRKRRPLKL